MTDADALLAAIVADPDEDLHRLVYADWLDENATAVRVCSGTHSHRGKMGFNHGVWHDSDPNYPHHHCDEKCIVPDGRAARAEFIRVQCEIARHDTTTEVCLCGYEPCDGYHHNSPSCPYVGSDALLAAHGWEWRGGARCSLCKGEGWYEGGRGPYLKCVSCRGTGWACWPLVEERSINDSSSPEQYLIRSTFRRGFPFRIELTHEQFTTPGVAGLIGHWHPTIQEVVLVGLDPVGPIDGGRYEGAWFWLRRDIPDQLEPYLSCIPESNPDTECGYYDTRDEANAALSRACVRVMRDEAGKLSR